MTSPLRGKYLVRQPLVNALLRCLDALLPPYRRKEIGAPRRILLSNLAHLGDVVIATSVLPALKKAYPEAEIGFLIGSWARPVLQEHPLVDYIHRVDHWKISRAPVPLWRKIVRYYRTSHTALREIKALRYDIAIDLYYYFPNSIPLLWQARIPVRIGYISGGFGRLLTHPLEWQNRKQPVAQYHFDLLSLLSIPRENPALPALSALPSTSSCIVCCAGPPRSLKAWDPIKWQELIGRLVDEGHQIIFTGQGLEEREHADSLHPPHPNLRNLCDQLSWQEFVSLISGAQLLISIDSVAAHIASGFQIPSIVFFCGISDPAHWCPPNAVACTRDITVDSIMEQVRKFLLQTISAQSSCE